MFKKIIIQTTVVLLMSGLRTFLAPFGSEVGYYTTMMLANTQLGRLGIAIVILDDDSNAEIRFETLDLKKSEKLGLTRNQIVAYNENVEIFNGIKDDIESKLIDSGAKGATEYAANLGFSTLKALVLD